MAVIKFKLSLKDFLDRWCCTHIHMWGLASKVTELRLQPDLSFLFRGMKVANRCVVFAARLLQLEIGLVSHHVFLCLQKLCSSLNWQQHLLYRMVILNYVFTCSFIWGKVACSWAANAYSSLSGHSQVLLVISQQRKLIMSVNTNDVVNASYFIRRGVVTMHRHGKEWCTAPKG